MVLFFITSGLFLGWSLGANDAANVFGSAVGTRMVTFKRAAIVASIFVILGAVFQGEGASHTLGKLGAVNALGGSFTVALAAALTVYWMTRIRVPVSTTQAIVGAIIGWNFFSGSSTDLTSLTKIVTTWVTGPLIGAGFAILLYMLLKFIKRRSRIHMVRYESYIRTGLLIVGAFGSYSLGANNIANVMGVFVPAISLPEVDLGLFTLNGGQQLFLLGGIAIAFGIVTYSEHVMKTVGNNLLELNADTALIIVLAHSLVLFIFSSTALSDFVAGLGLPRIPLVPVSSSQVIVGAIIGIGLYKGVGNINFKTLRGIVSGWVTTPVIACVISFMSLFFVQNVFDIPVFYETGNAAGAVVEGIEETTVTAVRYSLDPGLIISIIFAVIASIFGYLWYREKQKSDSQRY
ncbi:MAG TPA: inorganic phosphate transporter [Bacteroidales bacterium]|nr:inorganic phosphate transporter [Bacteroidales bacterium]